MSNQIIGTWNLRRLQFACLAGGALGSLAALVMVVLQPRTFFQAYLVAYQFWLGIGLGCLAILMIQYLTGGEWGFITRRILEAGTRTLPLLAILFLPLVFGLREIYPWAGVNQGGGDHHFEAQRDYLNIPFFLGRAGVYFLIWLGLMFLLNRWSRADTAVVRQASQERFRRVSAPGLILLGLAVTFAAIDWMMSLEPDWYSTIYGAMIGVGQILGSFAFVILVLVLLSGLPPLAEVLTAAHLQALGSLLLAFVMLWAYMAFSQYLLIWSGNLPEEVPWYLRRLHEGWRWLAGLLVMLHFALPFLLLLSRDLKRNRRTLAFAAGLVLVMRLADYLWLIVPAFPGAETDVVLSSLLLTSGIGGFWVAAFTWTLKNRPLLPTADSGPAAELQPA